MKTIAYSQEMKDLVRECGRNMTPPSQAAYIVGVPELFFVMDVRDRNSEIHQLYMEGMSETAHNIRKVNREIAEAGSPAAISELMQSLHDCMNELE